MIPCYHNNSDAKNFLRQRGTVLLLVAVLLFALLPLMTLVVHLGMVTLTRRQMQTAVNTAAKEGLRLSDNEESELDRRIHVRNLVSALFDDDLAPEDVDVQNFGAGPLFNIDGGTPLGDSNLRALTTVSLPEEQRAYKPFLRPNLGNERHGDMVAGQWIPNASHIEGPDDSRGLQPYERLDFRLSGDAEFDEEKGNDAFLVRMRRTDDAYGLDNLSGVSSSEEPIPFLFGRGPYGGTDFLNRRERGTIVRATAIARTQPVVTVGVPSTDVNAGLAIFEIDSDDWNPKSNGIPYSVALQADGTISGDLTGRFIRRELMTLGDLTVALESIPSDLELGDTRVAAITTTINGEVRVVAFGMVVLEQSVEGYSITRLSADENVPHSNASPAFLQPLEVSGSVFTDIWNVFSSTPERARAGALARMIR